MTDYYLTKLITARLINSSVSDSGLALTRSATDPTGAGSNLPRPSFSSISLI